MGESARKTVDQTRVSETLCINNLRKQTYMFVLSLGDDVGTYPLPLVKTSSGALWPSSSTTLWPSSGLRVR